MSPESTTTEECVTLSDSLRWNHEAPFPVPAGRWIWLLADSAAASPPDTATLYVAPSTELFRWRWSLPESLPAGHLVRLVPLDGDVWHEMTIEIAAPAGQRMLPLPRQACKSPDFDDLLGLLQTLTEPFFGQTVAHWPSRPIPVRVGAAVTGEVDLSACLVEAIDIWNDGEAAPWFRIDEEAAWGVRLIHFPDIPLSPPLEARITRLDDAGAPLRIQIVAGNDYQRLRNPKYVVRGFVHELAHALFLWGHSPDREHCLWGAAPPQVDRPSQDERKAARLWHDLPAGLDLSRYR